MKKNVKIIIALAVILLASLGIIIGVSDNKNSSATLSIVATNFPAYDFARAVAGDTAEIKMLLPPGTEPHDYEPTPQDIIDINNSDLFIYNGGESDAWLEDILNDLDMERTKVLKMMGQVDLLEEEGEHEPDEHVWTSLRNATKIINSIKDVLIQISPENNETFTRNTDDYTNKISDLDAEFSEAVRQGKRKEMVFGDRFPLRYFADDYNLKYYAAFPGCSEQTEADSKTIADLINKVKTKSIPVVFKIEMSSGELAETIAHETGAKVLEFNAAHDISAEDFKNGRTYVEIMTANLQNLKEALK